MNEKIKRLIEHSLPISLIIAITSFIFIISSFYDKEFLNDPVFESNKDYPRYIIAIVTPISHPIKDVIAIIRDIGRECSINLFIFSFIFQVASIV